MYAILAICLVVNTYLARLLPKVETVTLVVQVVGFFAVLITVVALGPHGSARDVFANFLDNGDWGSNGLSFFIGLNTSMFAFIGMQLLTRAMTGANLL